MLTSEKGHEMLKRKLGLIGNGISRSSAPRLHKIAGTLCGVEIRYDLIDLEGESPDSFEESLVRCATEGYWGVNVTYPFKEWVAKVVEIPSPTVRQIGSVNTVVFAGAQQGVGYNTDYSGFLRAYQRRFPTELPGAVGLVGTGGVGKSVAFGLARLGAQELRFYDFDRVKAEALAAAVRCAFSPVAVSVCATLAEATAGADGLVNCTPLGMWQHPGNPIPDRYIRDQRWAFDVIYTALETEFLAAARAAWPCSAATNSFSTKAWTPLNILRGQKLMKNSFEQRWLRPKMRIVLSVTHHTCLFTLMTCRCSSVLPGPSR